jgi:phospholipid N-methyltransferase
VPTASPSPSRTSARPRWRRWQRHAHELLVFARSFLQQPRLLGSVVPSSRFLVNRLLAAIDFSTARTIVEYGPGVGPMTRVLLTRMRPDARLIALEMHPDLVAYLRREFPDPRLVVVQASAEDAPAILARMGLAYADYVLSGIPFSTMPAAERRAVVRATSTVLRPGGMFVLFQYSRALLPDLRAHFRTVDKGFEPLNVPPAQLFFCTA